ncbi:Hypothetical predicted protein, partial [Paramuricea clavata]
FTHLNGQIYWSRGNEPQINNSLGVRLGPRQPLSRNPAVPLEEVIWLNEYMKDGREPVSFNRALYILRRKLFPFMHDPHPWVEGRPETTGEILKSILAIFLYRKRIDDLKHHVTDPADFSKNLYQPEKDKNGERIHHREDHNHLLKRIVSRLRGGHIPGIDLQHFRDALHDPTTGLTYEALTGKNKQSVPDCERLINPGVIAFLERNGHVKDANVVKRLHNWHKAVDGRGLTEEERSLYCRAMKEWLLDDWMPWFSYQPDFSTIDVNRKIKGICGLTKEAVIGLVANLESRELRRIEYEERGLPPEHPRASATDDVEGMIGLMHDMLGDIFDMKQFSDAQPKILNEFSKRIDPELQFYYWTGAKERYTEFELPSFNEPSGNGDKERLDDVKLSRRGDPGVFVANRASLPQKGQLTARAKFHREPVALPPPLTQETPGN